jgi:hypothetical protein
MSEQTPSNESLVFVSGTGELKDLLEEHGFDTSRWGEGPTKTVDALWEEVDLGETEILEAGGEIIRRTRVVGVDVFAKFEDGQAYRLVEEKQVYSNGSERRRELITSLGEKVKSGEDPEAAVRRAVAEELGITSLTDVELLKELIVEKASLTYNGLATQLLLRLAKVTISEEAFDPQGYTEVQPDKSVHFKWEKLEPGSN